MVHCTLNGLICRHKYVKNVLVQHLGELLGVLDLRASPRLPRMNSVLLLKT